MTTTPSSAHLSPHSSAHSLVVSRTALFEEHVALKGRMVPFAGWEMPVQYKGLKAEHLACRSTAGLFDVSHMGEILIEGPGSEGFLNRLLTNDVTQCAVGQAMYSVMCRPSGGMVDDLVFYRLATNQFFVVVNAANTLKDWEHLSEILWDLREEFPDVKASNVSSDWSQIALQGPKAEEILADLTQSDLSSIGTYRFVEGSVAGAKGIIARTGYTGEDGFEIYVPWSDGPTVWKALLEAGQPLGLEPVGLGARDTLRLEMKYSLYGQELSEDTHPLDAGLGWVVKLNKGVDFVGAPELRNVKEAGIPRKLVGFEMIDRGIPRSEYPLFLSEGAEKPDGLVTSGTHSPSLEKAIGIGYLPRSQAAIDQEIWVGVRGKKLRARIVKTPFLVK